MAAKNKTFDTVLEQKKEIIELKNEFFRRLGHVDDEEGKKDDFWEYLVSFISKLLDCLRCHKIYLLYKSTRIKIDDWYDEYNYRDVVAKADLFLRYLESDYESEIGDEFDHVYEIWHYQYKIIKTFQRIMLDHEFFLL
jgi:hypothetical protein